MSSGGARMRSGPAPDPNALRRDRKDDAAWTTLPADGRKGSVPVWPLLEADPREMQLWEEFWKKPQAVLWEQNQQFFEVALHIRTFFEAERPDASSALRTLVRQQADALLLTIPAMHAARVKIAVDEVAVKRAEQVPARLSARDRLKAVDGGAR